MSPLQRIKDAQRNLSLAQNELKESVLSAHAEGISIAAIARLFHTSRQNIHNKYFAGNGENHD